MISRSFVGILVLAFVVCADRAAAQESLRADYERCVADLTECCGPSKPDKSEGALASLLVFFREELPQMMQRGAAELANKGVKLSDTTLQATQKGADPQKQLAALDEITAAATKLDAGKAKKFDKASQVKANAVSTPAPAAPNVNQDVIKRQQIMR
ncbi:MAG TPA: hypothetical protein VFG30_08095 [Polyangiales bacterium]|jgi:hypothetical protein|nr:hypothetical protein [Polyangiales bacterium]